MRPRRTILLYCVDEGDRSWITFFTETTGKFRIIGGISGEPPIPDAVLVVDDRSLGTVTMARGIAALHPGVPMLLLLGKKQQHPAHGYPQWATILPGGSRPAEILEALRLATVRKKGPKGVRSKEIHLVATA